MLKISGGGISRITVTEAKKMTIPKQPAGFAKNAGNEYRVVKIKPASG